MSDPDKLQAIFNLVDMARGTRFSQMKREEAIRILMELAPEMEVRAEFGDAVMPSGEWNSKTWYQEAREACLEWRTQ